MALGQSQESIRLSGGVRVLPKATDSWMRHRVLFQSDVSSGF